MRYVSIIIFLLCFTIKTMAIEERPYQVIETIGKKIGRGDLIRLGSLPVQKNEPCTLVADTKKLTKEVGWTPKFDINTGLDQTIEWWKNNL